MRHTFRDLDFTRIFEAFSEYDLSISSRANIQVTQF